MLLSLIIACDLWSIGERTACTVCTVQLLIGWACNGLFKTEVRTFCADWLYDIGAQCANQYRV